MECQRILQSQRWFLNGLLVCLVCEWKLCLYIILTYLSMV
jgi:hypothetical protein